MRILGTLLAAAAILLAEPPAGPDRKGDVVPVDSVEWLSLKDLPYPLGHHMTALVQNDSGPRLFVIGGQRSPAQIMQQACIEYSPSTDSWQAREPMRYARGQGQAVTVRGEIWVMGGYQSFGTALTRVEVYHPATNSWSIGPNLPESLCDFGAAVWRDSLVYVIGGGGLRTGPTPSDRVWLFDPADGLYRPATPLPVPLGAMATGITGDTLLVAGGWTDSGPTSRAWRGLIDPAEPSVISWSDIESLPSPARCRPACAVSNSRLFVIGGISWTSADTSARALDEVWSLDARNGDWRTWPSMPHPVCAVAGSAADLRGRIYVPAGDSGATTYLRANQLLDLADYEHDVGVVSVTSPVGRIVHREVQPIVSLLRNFGRETETFQAGVSVVDTTSHTVVGVADTALSLEPESSLTVDFGSFTPESGHVFRTEVIVGLIGDENPGNDTLVRYSRTTTGSDPDGFGYVYESTQEPDTVAFAWTDTAGGTAISNWSPNSDDGVSRRRLPFGFPFYGVQFDRIYVCTNGFLAGSDLSPSRNRHLPDGTQIDLVAPFWDDLDLRSSGSVYENLSADRAVYTWINVPRYGTTAESLTFQVELGRAGTVRFNYLMLAGDRTSCTAGIQGREGSWYWYSEYVNDGIPANHTLTDSTTVLYYSINAAVTEPRAPAARPRRICLEVPAFTRPRVLVRISWPGPVAPGLSVYDAAGRAIRSVRITGPSPACWLWDGRDAAGRPVPVGSYFIRARLPYAEANARFVLLR